MQQIQTTVWSESAVHAQADLALLSCYYHHSICQKRSKCSRFKPQRGLNLLYMPRLILHCWAVTTIISSAKIAANAANSSHSVVWICCTCPGWSWTAELLLPSFHLPTQQMQQIQTTAWSESAVHALADLALLSCYYHHFICQNRSKCSEFKPQRGLNLLYMPRLILDCWAVTTIISSAKIAANAANSSHSVVWICCTCPGWSWTAELLLPSFHLPKAQQMQQIQTTAWSESAVHAQADLALLSCYYHHFIYHNRSKCSRFKPQRGLNLLYMLSLILDCWAVTTILLLAPCNNWLICHNRSKCSRFKPQQIIKSEPCHDCMTSTDSARMERHILLPLVAWDDQLSRLKTSCSQGIPKSPEDWA